MPDAAMVTGATYTLPPGVSAVDFSRVRPPETEASARLRPRGAVASHHEDVSI